MADIIKPIQLEKIKPLEITEDLKNLQDAEIERNKIENTISYKQGEMLHIGTFQMMIMFFRNYCDIEHVKYWKKYYNLYPTRYKGTREDQIKIQNPKQGMFMILER